jgi:hypothetical protein
MDDICKELNSIEQKGNFDKTVDHVQDAIDLLIKAKDKISNDPSAAAITLAGLKKPVKESFDKVNGDLKEVHSVLTKYSKALDRVSLVLASPCVNSAKNGTEVQRPTSTVRSRRCSLRPCP